MVGPSSDRMVEWEGGSLPELVAMLEAAALPVRIEVIAPGTTDSSAGEIHLLAGGLAEAFAGSLRMDDAMAALQRLEGARYLVESRLPDPDTGSLSEPGPQQGTLTDRPLASLMRYCEDYVLTCQLEVSRGREKASIRYNRGEIASTLVNGGDGTDRLPEVLAWTDGSYEIVLPSPVLPQARKRETVARPPESAARPERKRHTTLPMMGTTQDARAVPPLPPPVGARPPSAGSVAQPTPPQRPTPPPVVPRGRPQLPPPTPQAVPTATLQEELTTRGTPPVPQVPLLPPPTANARPTAQGTVARAAQQQVNPAGSPAPKAVPPPTPPPQRQAPPAPQRQATAPTPPPVRQAPPPTPPPQRQPALPAPQPQRQAPPPPRQRQAREPVGLPAPLPQRQAPPSAQAAPPSMTARAADKPAVRPARPATPPEASNDLLPASGTIDAKPRYAHQLPPPVDAVQVSSEPVLVPSRSGDEHSTMPVEIPFRPMPARRLRPRSRKGIADHPVRIYVLIGLAIGVGIVLAYWAYWFLPFGHH